MENKYMNAKMIDLLKQSSSIKEDLTPVKACKLICCIPAQAYLKTLAYKWNWNPKAYDKIHTILIELEKRFGIGKYYSYKIAVAISLYIFSKLYLRDTIIQKDVAQIGKTTVSTIRKHYRKTISKIKFKKDPHCNLHFFAKKKYSEEFDYYGWDHKLQKINIKRVKD